MKKGVLKNMRKVVKKNAKGAGTFQVNVVAWLLFFFSHKRSSTVVKIQFCLVNFSEFIFVSYSN